MKDDPDMKKITEQAINHEKKLQEMLQEPELLLKIVERVHNKGVVGEENTIITLVNKIEMRLVKNKEPTSDNIIVSDKTGGGKDFIVKKTCEVIVPTAHYKHRTDLSDKTFDYWKPITGWYKDEKEKNKPIYDSWNGYVLHLEDPREEALNGQSFKVMSSGGTEVTKVIDNRAKDIKVDGKPAIIVTSLNTMINLENLRRWDTLRIDTSTRQTEEINKCKLQKASGKTVEVPDDDFIQALQTMLFPKTVLIPYAEKLGELLPNNLLSRTQVDKLLDEIKSSAVLHQYQRKKIDNSTIEADYFDLAYGWFVFTHLNSSSGVPMNSDEEELVKLLIQQEDYIDINKLSEIYQTHSKQWLYLQKEKLINKGLIKTKFEHSEQANKEVEKISYGDNANLVLKGFNDVLTIFDMIGFNGFKGFNQICEKIEKIREKQGLEPSFSQIWLKRLKPENDTLKPILKLQKNQLKPNSSQEGNFIPKEEKEKHLLETHRTKDNGSFDFCCDTEELQYIIDYVQENYNVLTDTTICDKIKPLLLGEVSDKQLSNFVDEIYEIIVDCVNCSKE